MSSMICVSINNLKIRVVLLGNNEYNAGPPIPKYF